MWFDRQPKERNQDEMFTRSPAQGMENLVTGFKAALYGGGAGENSKYFNRMEVWSPIIEELREYGGDFENPAMYGTGILFPGLEGNPALARRSEQEIYDWAIDNQDAIPPDLFEQVNELAINQKSLELKLDYERQLEELSRIDPSVSGAIGRFTGALATGFADPTTVPSMPFGGWSKTLWKNMFQNAAINAGVGVLSEVDVADWYDELGLDYTAEQFFTNIGLQAAFGAALPAAGRTITKTAELTGTVGGLTIEQAKRGWRAIAKSNPEAITPESRAMASILDAQEEVELNNPLTGFDYNSNALAQYEHGQRMVQTLRAIETGEPIKISTKPDAFVAPQAIEGAIDNIDGFIYKFDPNELEVDAATFQFKTGGDEFGVTEKYKDVVEWDADAANQIMVFEYADGRRVIADGHQRMGIARRIMANDPSQKITLYGIIKREVDGHTPLSVRLDAAFKNITEGSGSILDAAEVFKIDPSRLKGVGASQVMQDGNSLARLGEEAYVLVQQGIVPEKIGAVIGRIIDDKELHLSAAKIMKDLDPRLVSEAEAIAEQIKNAPKEVIKETTLFGDEFLVETLFRERAKILNDAISQIKRDKAAFANINRNAQRLEAEGNKVAKNANQTRIDSDAKAIALIKATANRKGSLSDALNAAARAAKETGNYRDATTRFLGDIRRGIEQGDFDRLSRRDVGDDVQPSTKVAPNRIEPQQEVAGFSEPGGEGTIKQTEELQRSIFGDNGKRFPTKDELSEMIANDEIVPDYRYYLDIEDGVEIPTNLIKPLRARPDGIENSQRFMATTAKSELGLIPEDQRMTKRGPLQVLDDGDGTYTLLDGNSTYAVAVEAGMPTLPAKILTMEEFSRATQKKAMDKILKPEVKFEEDGVTPKKPKRRIVNKQEADPAEFQAFSIEQKKRSPNKSLDEALERGEKNHIELADKAESIADELDIFVSQPKVKSRERAQEKLDRKYKNADGTYRYGNLTDIARTGFIIERVGQLDEVVKALSARGLHVVNEGFEFTPLGYFDAKLNVIFEDGTMGEVQLWVPGMLEAKGDRSIFNHQHLPENASDLGIGKMPGDEGYMPGWSGHDYYEVFERKDPRITPEMRFEAQERQLVKYGAVQELLDDEFKAFIGRLSQSAPKTLQEIKASFGEISGDLSSVKTTSGSIDAQSPSPQARANVLSLETTTGVSPSIINQRMNVPPLDDVTMRVEYTNTELTAEGLQTVIPGAERISDRELAQRKMDDIMSGRNDPMPEGSLFDDARTADMFDDPNLLIRLEDENGNQSMRTISEVKEEIKKEDDFLKQLGECSI